VARGRASRIPPLHTGLQPERGDVSRPTAAVAPASETPDPRRWAALAIVLTGSFMVNLDTTIVNVAIPSIERGLGASYAAIEWVVSGYTLSYGALLITGGKLGDLFGRKRIFLAGMTLFTLASVACGAAPDPEWLILARVVQGAGAGLLFPQIVSTVHVSFAGRERGTAFGLIGATIGVATVIGPLAGGILIQLDLAGLDWRPIFLVNLPVGIVSIAAAAWLMRSSRSADRPGLDPRGVALATTGLLLLLLPLVEGRDAGWAPWTWASLVASFVFLCVFVAYEARRRNAGLPTLIELPLFRDRAFGVGMLMALVYFAGFASLPFTLSLFLQIGLAFGPLAAGLTLAPFAVGSFAGASLSGRAANRLGPLVEALGTGLVMIGMAGTIVVVQLARPDLTGWETALPLLVAGLGSGLIIAPLINASLAGVAPRVAGAGSGMINTSQRLGSAIGIALIGVVFFSLIGGGADRASATAVPALTSELAGQLPAEAVAPAVAQFQACFRDRANEPDPTRTPPSCPAAGGPLADTFGGAAARAQRELFSDAFEQTTWVNIALVALTFLLSFLLPRRRVTKGSANAQGGP
jgi:EmrB/QacA subfamily drug resistance transporter